MINLRNICIIAHVDHGKTTLVDHLLRQAGTFQKHKKVEDRVMDSMDLERERGITILAKNTSIRLKAGTGNLQTDTKINIVDTPGHADFGGEVERIMSMVEGALLLVDAAEGPLPQTRFVLQKALSQGLRVILVINKVDRSDARVDDVVNQTFDLFVELGANSTQLDFPILYACARGGWCTTKREDVDKILAGTMPTPDLQGMFDTVLENVPPPKTSEFSGVDPVSPQSLQLLVSNLGYSDFVGRLAIGRIMSGVLRKSQKVARVHAQGKENFSITALYTYEGLEQVEVQELEAGDIAVFAGSEKVEIGDSVLGSDVIPALPRISVEKPTLSMIFSVNTSPLSGQEGEAIQSRKLRERLLREVRQNVALKFEETAQSDQFRILGRGELQFAILIEQMRREGLEFMVGKPTVLYMDSPEGRQEPMERAVLDLPEAYSGDVTRMFQERKGLLTKFEPVGSPDAAQPRVRLEFEIPTRGLLGMRSHYLTATRGAGLFSTYLLGYGPHKGDLPHRTVGSLVSDREGKTVEYGLLGLEDRGILFFGPGVPVYEGMIIGENSKEDDLNVNPCREKKLTNIRAASAEFLVTLSGIKKMSLEHCIEWIDEDEWIEITPQSIRLRKKVLQANLRSVKREDRIR